MTSVGTVTPTPPKSPSIDPRIRARRVAVRRDDGRRRLHRLVALSVIAALTVASVLVTRSPILDVDRIEVVGAAHSGADAVRAATGVLRHSPMTDLDLSRARAGVLGLAWVKTATVTRQWPGTVRVSVVERTPIAAAPAAAGGYVLVDDEGRLLEAVAAPPIGVVALAGLAPAGAVGDVLDASATAALAVARALPAELVAQVAAVAAAPDGVELRLAVGGKARLGPADDIAKKLLAVATFLDQVDLTDLCALDVRVPSAPSLTRGAPCA